MQHATAVKVTGRSSKDRHGSMTLERKFWAGVGIARTMSTVGEPSEQLMGRNVGQVE